MRRSLARLFLALALLGTQVAGYVHALEHLADAAPATGHVPKGHACDLCYGFSGAGHVAPPPPSYAFPSDPGEAHSVAAGALFSSRQGLAPACRGPPSLLR